MKSFNDINDKPNFQSGITFIELVVVIGILTLLLSITFIGAGSIRIAATNSNFGAVIISDLRSQQIKAMSGDTEGRPASDNYGIKFLSDEYIHFNGSVYNPTDPSNFSFSVYTGYTVTTTFPDDTVLFEIGSGEIIGFAEGQNTITVTNTGTGQARTIELNKYGTITEFN